MIRELLTQLDIPVNDNTQIASARFCTRWQQLGGGDLAVRRVTAKDLSALQELIHSVNWQVADADINAILEHGELWVLTCNKKFISSAGWVEHGGDRAWMVLVTTRPQWRGCSAATLMMYKALKSCQNYSKRMLDASNMGENVYRRIGFKDCARVDFYEIEPSAPLPAPAQHNWQPMEKSHFPLPGSLPDDPAIKLLFERAPELCYVAKQDGRIAAWFIGREKTSHIHIGPIYAQQPDMAVDAVFFMRNLQPERKITLDVFADETFLVENLKKLSAAFHHSHVRMYYASQPVPRAGENIRSSAGPDFG